MGPGSSFPPVSLDRSFDSVFFAIPILVAIRGEWQ